MRIVLRRRQRGVARQAAEDQQARAAVDDRRESPFAKVPGWREAGQAAPPGGSSLSQPVIDSRAVPA